MANKMLSAVFCLLFSCQVWAVAELINCADTPEDIIGQISIAPGCNEAAQVAKDCAYGSSTDVQFVMAAEEVCKKDLGELSKKEQKAYDKALKKCARKYSRMEGTMYRSMHAYCTLDALHSIYQARGPEER